MRLQGWSGRLFLYEIRVLKGTCNNCVSADCANYPRSYPASADGFSIYSGIVVETDATPAIRHPGSERAFQDIHVLKLLDCGWNIKKISSSFAGQL